MSNISHMKHINDDCDLSVFYELISFVSFCRNHDIMKTFCVLKCTRHFSMNKPRCVFTLSVQRWNIEKHIDLILLWGRFNGGRQTGDKRHLRGFYKRLSVVIKRSWIWSHDSQVMMSFPVFSSIGQMLIITDSSINKKNTRHVKEPSSVISRCIITAITADVMNIQSTFAFIYLMIYI